MRGSGLLPGRVHVEDRKGGTTGRVCDPLRAGEGTERSGQGLSCLGVSFFVGEEA